jgi:hypothetical protein
MAQQGPKWKFSYPRAPPMSILSQHIGHRTVPLDDQRLRCLDCTRVLLITTPSQSTSPTSTGLLRIDDPQQCPQHIGERDGACGPCRSEQLEDTTTRGPIGPTGANPHHNADWQAARALAANRTHRTTTTDGAPT